jgi:hypothetical protein
LKWSTGKDCTYCICKGSPYRLVTINNTRAFGMQQICILLIDMIRTNGENIHRVTQLCKMGDQVVRSRSNLIWNIRYDVCYSHGVVVPFSTGSTLNKVASLMRGLPVMNFVIQAREWSYAVFQKLVSTTRGSIPVTRKTHNPWWVEIAWLRSNRLIEYSYRDVGNSIRTKFE